MSMKPIWMTGYRGVSLISAIGLLLTTSIAGWGQEAGSPTSRVRLLLEALDTNQDGKLSRAEFPGTDEQFKQLDVDGDGYIANADFLATAEEVRQRARTRATEKMAETIAKYDDNHDGMLSRNEFPGSDEQFRRFDANGDGQLNEEEFRAAAQEIGQTVRARIAELDTNGDGMLSRAEFPGSDRQFEELDVNNDGLISSEEFKEVAQERVRAKRPFRR